MYYKIAWQVFILEWNISSHNNIKVYITSQEFILAGIDPQSDHPGNIKKLKRYLLAMLAQAKLNDIFPYESDVKLIIEVYPDKFGGAEIHFLPAHKTKTLCQPQVFCFYDSTTLIEATIKLFSLYGHRIFKSTLYQFDRLWLLTICLLDEPLSPAILLLSEYGFQIPGSDETAALIEEHCKPIIKQRAADTISYYFS